MHAFRTRMVLISILMTLSALAKRLVEVDVSRIDGTTHVEVRGDQAWNFGIRDLSQKDVRTIRVTSDPLNQESEQLLLGYSDVFIKGVRIDPDGPDGQHYIYFDLKKASTSVFHYLSNSPTRLVLDFYTDTSLLAKRTRKTKARGLSSDFKIERKSKIPGINKRNLAGKTTKKGRGKSASDSGDSRIRLDQDFRANRLVDQVGLELGALPQLVAPDQPNKEIRRGIFDGGDPGFKRFSISEEEIDQNAIIKSGRNVYLPFPMLEDELRYLEALEKNLPIYKIVPNNTDENHLARLVLKLFNNNREAMFTHTKKMFHEKYPDSKYRELILFMEADLAYKHYMRERTRPNFEFAMDKYTVALREFPKSPLAERVMLMEGFALLNKRNALGTLSLFGEYLRKYPESPRRHEVNLAVASAYIHLRRYKDALKIYESLSKHKKDSQYAKEASYRTGDIFFHNKEYRKAVEQYQLAFKEYPNDWSQFPNAFYNSGEALFWMGEYRKALDFYRDFLRRFPENSHAGYAMTRIGELMEILGAKRQRVEGAFLETYFRYGTAPGADVAQLRLLSFRMRRMKGAELNKTIEKMYAIGKESYLEGMNQYVTVMVADGLRSRGDFTKAIGSLDNFFRQNPTRASRELIGSRIFDNVYRSLKKMIETGKYIEALKLYDQYKSNWLKGHDRIDIPFLVGKAYEKAGAYKQAKSFYQDVRKRLAALPKEKMATKKVFEFVPTLDSANLRVAASSLKMDQIANAEKALLRSGDAGLTESEKVEKTILASRIAEKMGRIGEAIELLGKFIKNWSGDEKELAPSHLRLGLLQKKSGKGAEATKSFAAVSEIAEKHSSVDPKIHARALEELGSLHLQSGKSDEAFAVWNKLLEKYEGKLPLAAVRYKAGKILFSKKDFQKAVEFWERLKEEKNPFWYDLAQEQLKNSQWHEDYKKYIKRIPAMAQGEGSNDDVK